MKTPLPNRLPAQLEQRGGKSKRQRIWEAIRARQQDLSAAELASVSGVDNATTISYLRALEKGGYLHAHSPASRNGTGKRYRLLRDNGVEAPRLNKNGQPVSQGSGNETLWRTMRILGQFNSRELIQHAASAGIHIADDSANIYLRTLYRAGYLQLLEASRPLGVGKGKTLNRYRLLPGKYTGPRPPLIQRSTCVYDPNLARVVWQEDIRHDDD